MRRRPISGGALNLGWWLTGAMSLGAMGCSPVPVAAQPPEAVVTLLHTSDWHSRVWPFRSRISSFEAELGLGRAGALDEVGGLARLDSLLQAAWQRAPSAVWLDSGDALEGAEIFHRYAGSAEIALLSALGLSAMALGNHELSLPPAELAERAVEARFPLLAANLSPRSSSPLLGAWSSSALVKAGGLWLGVIGVANLRSPPSLSDAENTWQVTAARDSAHALQTAIDEISSRAALVVVLSHLGLDEDRALVRSTTGVDVVLGGHQHLVTAEAEWEDDCQSFALQRSRGCAARRVPIVHSGAYGKWLSRIELQLVDDGAGYEVAELALGRAAASADVPPSPRVIAALEPLQLPPEPPLAFAPTRIAREAALGGDAALGNLTTDAVRLETGADVVLLNTSGLRADIEAGLVSRGDLELAFPFEEPWRSGLVPGAALRRGLLRSSRKSAARECVSALQVSGMRLRLRCSGCADANCVEAWRGDTRLDDAELVRVALPEYLASAGADFAELRPFTEPIALDVVAAISRYFSFSALPARVAADCVEAALELSALRCGAAFGLAGCPVTAERARGLCGDLPRLAGGRDDRIQVLR